jgi:PqqD family protein of HPr-rel-A system
VWRHWDAEHIVFNGKSGDTHLLDDVSAATLRLLDRAMEPNELSSALATELDVTVDQELRDYVDRAVHHLYALGLIERA